MGSTTKVTPGSLWVKIKVQTRSLIWYKDAAALFVSLSESSMAAAHKQCAVLNSAFLRNWAECGTGTKVSLMSRLWTNADAGVKNVHR